MSQSSFANDSLDRIWEEIWSCMKEGADFSKPPMGTPAFSSGEKDQIDSRIVILRKVDNKERVLICHSDARAKKVRQLQDNALGNWLFWDADNRTQIRLRTHSSIHHLDDVAKVAWKKLSPSSKTNYSVTLHPGSEISSPKVGIAAYHRNMSPDPTTESKWFQNFVVIVSRVIEADWLCLSREGHHRARFIVTDQGVEKSWIVP